MSNNRKILIADDDATMRLVLSQTFLREGFLVRTTSAAGALLKWIREGEGDLVISDVLLPDENIFNILPEIRELRPTLPIILMSGQNTLLTAVSAAETGTFEYLAKPFDMNELVATAKRALSKPGPTERSLQATAARSERLPLIGRSPVMQDAYRTLARLTHTDLTVLIQGESGTGKNLAARALHDLGRRRGGKFVVVPLGATPRDRVEADLFGSADQVGALVEADGGTIMLDQIDDLPLDAQTRLLRVIDGSEKAINPATGREVSPRLIVSSKVDLQPLIGRGLFREDLYFRLNVAVVRMPALRDHPEDIAELAQVFLLRAARDGLPAKNIAVSAVERLQKHEWPGNVRELENLMRRVAALYPETTVSARSIHQELSGPTAPPRIEPNRSFESLIEQRLSEEFIGGPDNMPLPGLYDRIIDDVGRPLLRATLTATRGNQVRAAEILGLNRNTLKKKLRQLGMPTSRRELVQMQGQGRESSAN
ncbi:MAG: sigma 54-interacting transcriptional regulator [Caulobacteraceae bacterium]